LFAFAQAVIDPSRGYTPLVVSPNPFYQIYEGAAYLAGAEPRFLNTLPANDYAFDFTALSEAEWQRGAALLSSARRATRPARCCASTTGNSCSPWPTATASSSPPTSATRRSFSTKPSHRSAPAGRQSARSRLRALVMFSSLSKRSNVPGMRSGFVAGDAATLKAFLLYRTYHGSAMSPAVQAASVAAWNDELHVVDNRRQYTEKFAAVTLAWPKCCPPRCPTPASICGRKHRSATASSPAGCSPTIMCCFCREAIWHVPPRVNPGAGFVRIALVAPLADCVEAAERIRSFISKL
jgi:N-succinyldiaminopimelate aminotransferase